VQLINETTQFILAATLRWFPAGGTIRIAHYDVIDDVITRKLQQIEKNGDHLTPWNRLSYPLVKTASLYDNFCKNRKWRHLWRYNLGSRWKLQKMARENFSIGAFYNITKNQNNPIKTVGWDSFLSPKTPKNTSFLGVTQPPRTAPIF